MAEEINTMEEKAVTINEKSVSPKAKDSVSEEKPEANTKQEEKPKENGTTHQDEEEDGDGGSSSEEELGTLEKPVEILSRKRDRKSTDRFTDRIDKLESKVKPEDELDYSKGRGMKLGDIEFIKYNFDKNLADDLKPLHNLCFRRIGKATEVKKNLRAFCGFPFDKESSFYTKVGAAVDRFNLTGLKFVCGLLGVERGGDKTAIKDRLIEFLMEPKDLGKTIPQKKKKTPAKKKKTPKKSSPSKTPKKKTAKSDSTVADDVSEASDDSDDDGDEKEKKVEKPKKKKKSESPKKKISKDSKKKKPTPVKIAVPKKKKKDTPKKSEKRKSMDSDEDDDEPLVKKSKSEPTDAEIKKEVAEILKDADLEQVTMKTVCRQVYDRYPDFDLTTRKDFIKATVKEIIS